jgi:tetratricopeptide (TPR) repeat protein
LAADGDDRGRQAVIGPCDSRGELSGSAGMPAVKSSSARSLVFGVVGVLIAALFIAMAAANLTEWSKSSPREENYNSLVEGLRHGRVSLNTELPAGFAQLPDPYDPIANARFRAWPFELHDLSYFKGKLYLYFGVTPALVLFWPWAALTRSYLPQRFAVGIFCVIGFWASLGLLRGLCRRYFPGTGLMASAALAVALGLMTSASLLLQRPEVWEVPIACGYAFGIVALVGVWQALHAAARRGWWLALASLAMGLAVGARPSLLFGSALLLVPLLHCGASSPRRGLDALALWVAAFLPLVLCGCGLLIYNQLRFDRFFEFGQHFQLALDRQDSVQHFSPRFLGFNFRVYFLEAVRWSRQFPFVGQIASPPLPAGHAPVDEPFGILANLPVLAWGLAAPLAWRNRPDGARIALRGWVISTALLFLGSAVTLCLFYGSCSRYEVELLPALALLAVTGILSLDRALSARPGWRLASRFSWGFALAFSSAFVLLVSIGRYAEQRAGLGNLLLELGRPAEAIPQFEAAVRAAPGSIGNHVALGNCLTELSQFPRAIASYEKARQLDPASSEINCNLANVLVRAQRLPEAEACYREALRLDPNSIIAHFNLATLLAQTGHGPEAIQQLELVVRLQPADANGDAILGMALAQLGRLPEAMDHFTRAVRAEPANLNVRMNFGNTMLMAGHPREAAEQYEATLRLEPDQAEARYHLAEALQRLGQTDAAASQREQALKLKPELGGRSP